MQKHEVAEFEWDMGGERLKLKTKYAMLGQALVSMTPSTHSFSNHLIQSGEPRSTEKSGYSGLPHGVEKDAGSIVAALNHNQKQIVSPFVGTFYRAPTPEAEPYAKEGQVVKRGDVLCIVEAMKLMNEIEAELPGKIIAVLVENGQPVEFGEPLFIIEPK